MAHEVVPLALTLSDAQTKELCGENHATSKLSIRLIGCGTENQVVR
jgi:hypothetical protein